MGAITEIFKSFADDYLAQHPGCPGRHRKVINAIINCRSGEYGATAYRCEGCGCRHIVYRSCGDRHCPQCQYHKSREWLHRQMARIVPGHHFMLTFTVPEELRHFIRSNQKLCYGALFAASADAIKLLARDTRFVGADLAGFTGVLHTWGRQLQYHPHIHYLVPGGGLNVDRNHWLPSRSDFFLPVKALSKIFRAKFKTLMAKAGLVANIDPVVWNTDWNVNSQSVGDAEATLKYLAPYIFRVAISDSRIVAFEGRTVTFSYRKKGSNRQRKMTLDALEFIRRYLQHVLPPGFMKVRHYGFLNPNCAVSIAAIHELASQVVKLTFDFVVDIARKAKAEPPTPICSSCGGKLLYLFSLIPGRPGRAPT